MADTIPVESLLAGDVLLYKGRGFVSEGIRFFDGAEFSHASLYLGDGDVGEAIAKGLVRQDIATSVHGSDWVRAYRLKDRPSDMSPVLDKAEEYLAQGNRYGFEQLVLLAFLCLTRKLKVTPSLRILIRRVLDAAAATVTRLLSQNREPMICSEFVYRAYDEALPEVNDPFSLRINELVRAMLRALPQMAAPAGAQFQVPRGQGVHPESLLAFLTSQPSGVWVEGLGEPGVEAAPAPLAIDQAEIEELIAQYLEEVIAEPAPGLVAAAPTPEGATLADLRAATERFAASLHAVAEGEPSLPADVRGALAAGSPMSTYLLRTAGDFVTPADLHRTQSLFVVGQLEM